MIKNNKKNVVFFIPSLAGGGAERVTVEMINALDRDKFRPILAVLRKEGPYLPHVNDSIDILEMTGCAGYRNIFRFRRKIKEIIDNRRPDFIVSKSTAANRAILCSTMGLRNVPPILICEENNLSLNLMRTKNLLRRELRKKEIQFLYKNANRIICVSEGVKNDLISNFGISEGEIRVIHNPVNLDRINNFLQGPHSGECRSLHGVKRIVAVGRLIKQKGFHDLLKAFAKVREYVPSSLTILGEGELRPSLSKMVIALGLHGYVDFPGFVDNPWSIIRASDLFILSSHWEGFGLVLVEAMACGTPIISTDCDYGPREIIRHGQNGILVPVADIEIMADAIVKVLKDDKLRQSLAENGKKAVHEYDIKKVVSKYESLLEEVLRK